jgi:hypothetical protein
LIARRASGRALALFLAVVTVAANAAPASASPDPPGEDTDEHAQGAAAAAPSWRVSLDGTAFVTGDFQGGLRGERHVASQNWFMAMAERPLGPGALTLTGMFSAEPLTVPAPGYSEIFQVGEASNGLQITDRQHPHDLFMQLSGAWRVPVGDRSALTIAGGPVGEPTLGPVAFMHRPSAAENPTAPLSHHLLDSTHIASSVVMGRVDAGVFAFEASAFHGREPDDQHYDVPLGALDSWAARVWVNPGRWTIQASHGFLHEPEQLEPGDQRRTNASVSWLRTRERDYSALTVAAGRVERQYSTLNGLLAEGTHHVRRVSLTGRFEWRTEETEILLFPEIVHRPHPGELVDPIAAATAGAVYDVAYWGPLAIGAGGDATWYRVPPLLQFTHGEHPVSFHAFLRISRADPRSRMWNMTMGGHSSGHSAVHDHHEQPD